MKNFGKIVLAILILFAVFVTSQAKADEPPPSNYHFVEQCTKISGINDSLDYYVIGYISGPGAGWNSDSNKSYIVKNEECLHKGYKFNDFKLYAVSKTYLDQKGLQNIDFPNDSNAIPSDIANYYFGTYVENSNPLIKETYTYAIKAFSKSTRALLLDKAQYIAEYNNGSPQTIENYPITLIWSEDWTTKISEVPPAPTPSPTTTSTSTSSPTPTITITENPIINILSGTGSSVVVLIIAGVLVIICVGLYFIMKKKK